MPGVVGLIARNKSRTIDLQTQFKRMARLLSHFDYYETEQLTGQNYLIGRVGIPHRGYRSVRRDELSGNQVAFDGYVYGWRGVCNSPHPATTEPVSMIPLGKETDFENIPDHINGAFTMCLHNAANGTFYLANDRIGYRRLYYYQNDEIIAFAPEIKAFLGLDSFQRELNLEAAFDLLNYHFVIGDRTLYKDVSLLFPASIIAIRDRTLSPPRQYWQHIFAEELDGDGDRLAREMYEMGHDILKRQMGQHDRFVMALSGGMDSRLLAHYLSKTDAEAHYYTHGNPKTDDTRIARKVAETLGVSPNFRQLDYDQRCYAKWGAWTAWLVDGMVYLSICDLVSILDQYQQNPLEYEFLNSQASGNINFASAYGMAADITDKFTLDDKMYRFRRVFGAHLLDERYYNLFAPQYRQMLKEAYDKHILEEYRKVEGTARYFVHEKDYFLNHRTRGLRLSMQYDLNKYFFHNHFALVDDEIVDFYNRMPMNWQVERRLYRKMYQDLIPDMAGLEYFKTGGGIGVPSMYQPPDQKVINWRKRIARAKYWLGRLSAGHIKLYDYRTYLHQNIWYRRYAENRRFFEGVLLDPRTATRGFYNIPAIEALLKKQTHGSSNYQVIAILATFELFNRYFIEGDDPPIYWKP